MDMTGIGGIWPATLTPFAPDGTIDEHALSLHYEQLVTTPGVRALVVNGHAGEATSLDASERQHVIRVAKRVAAGRVGVVAGIVAEDTRGACNLAKDAMEAGADALLLFPPAVLRGVNARPEMAMQFVRTVASATPLPIVLFQLSIASGAGYSTELLTRLCNEVDSVIAVKEGSDTPADYEANCRALASLPRKITVLSSNNTWLLASLMHGADGILSGIGSVAAPLLAEMFDAFQRGDIQQARHADDRLNPLSRVFYRAPAFDMHNRMKTALNLLGQMAHCAPRPPLMPIEEQERATIRRALIEAGLLT